MAENNYWNQQGPQQAPGVSPQPGQANASWQQGAPGQFQPQPQQQQQQASGGPSQQAQANTSWQQGAPGQYQPQPQQQQQQQAWQPQPSAMPQGQPFGTAPAYVQVPVYQQPQVVQKKSHGWIGAVVIIVCLFAFTAFAVKSCTDAMSSVGGSGSGYGISGASGLSNNAIAVIDIDGTIQYDGSACSPEGLKKLLDAAEDNDRIKAVVLRVNSGGGTATAGEEMAAYVRDFSKPVVVSSASINASAAYEISSQADYIYVAQSTEIGAIGTAMQLTDLSGLLDMLGVNMDVITSAEQKDSSYGYRPLTEEERAYYQAMVNQINEVFVKNVADGRRMSVEDVKALATGMPFTGTTSVENGLADAIGTREDAVDKAAELAGLSSGYDTTTLSLSSYDLSNLAYLLGEYRSSTDSLADLLKKGIE